MNCDFKMESEVAIDTEDCVYSAPEKPNDLASNVKHMNESLNAERGQLYGFNFRFGDQNIINLVLVEPYAD
jgi:hypothetical protein